MASLTHEIGTPLDRPERPRVVRVGPDRLGEAVTRLLGDRAGGPSADEFIATAESDGLDLTLMWAALRPAGDLGEVALVTPGVGKAASVFVSGAGSESRQQWEARRLATAERAAALTAACHWLAGAGAAELGPTHLVQTLIEPRDEHLIQPFLDAGFTRLAELGYLRRELPAKGRIAPPVFPAGVDVVSLAAMDPREGMNSLQRAMERSYIGTLDCPQLCGIREPRDVLESHLAVGDHDPRLWFLVTQDGQPEGCMLLTPCPSQESVELVYVGIGPELRGRGIGAGLITLALSRLGGRRETTLACAVDLANGPALKLYKNAKFRQFASRTAMVMSLRKS